MDGSGKKIAWARRDEDIVLVRHARAARSLREVPATLRRQSGPILIDLRPRSSSPPHLAQRVATDAASATRRGRFLERFRPGAGKNPPAGVPPSRRAVLAPLKPRRRWSRHLAQRRIGLAIAMAAIALWYVTLLGGAHRAPLALWGAAICAFVFLLVV